MKKLLIILLLSSYLFSATDMDELLKINFVVEHYREHKKTDSSISFVSFLLLHYNNEDSTKKSTEHNRLPFKSHRSVFTTNTFFSFLPNKENGHSVMPVISPNLVIYPEQRCSVITNYQALVWHPPQYS